MQMLIHDAAAALEQQARVEDGELDLDGRPLAMVWRRDRSREPHELAASAHAAARASRR